MTDAESLPAFHLAIYTDALALGGAEMNLSRILGALPSQVRVTVVGVDEDVVEWLRGHRPGTAAMVLPPISGRTDVANIARHRAMFRRLDAQVLQFNLSTASSCQWAIVAACAVTGVARIVIENSPMGVWSSTSGRLKRATARRLDAHVAVGRRTATMIEDSSGLPPGSLEVIYHGVPPAGHEPVDRPADPTLLCVARHDPVKGVDVLLDAWVEVPEPARLVLVGEGPATADLRARCARLGLEERVEFRHGSWDGVRISDQMWAFDGLVLPSRLEGFPVTIVEAMLAGIPVVATRVGSVEEAVETGGTGWIVEPEDPPALAAAIRELLDDPAAARRMGERARSIAERRFTLDATIEAYARLYRRVLDA